MCKQAGSFSKYRLARVVSKLTQAQSYREISRDHEGLSWLCPAEIPQIITVFDAGY